jgi:hypothetical protein
VEMSPEYTAILLKAQGDTYFIRLALLHHLIGSLLQPSREHGVLAVDKLLLLPTRHFDLLRVGHNDVVTTVKKLMVSQAHTTRVIDRFVFAHEHERDALRKLAEHSL